MDLLQKPLLWPEEATNIQEARCENGEGRFPFICCEAKEIKLSSNFLNLDPEKSECGLDAEDKIYGGKATGLDEFPWFALLEYENSRILFKLFGFSIFFTNSRSFQKLDSGVLTVEAQL